jgi:hypothetical protein
MPMLPKYYKFHVLNKTGQTIDCSSNPGNEGITVTTLPWKFQAGQVAYGTEQAALTAATDLTNNNSEEGSLQTNTDYMGVHGTITVQTDNTSVAGDIVLGIEWSTNGTTFPSDSADFDVLQHCDLLVSVYLDDAATKTINFEI